MDLAQLQTFVAVARESSITRASQRLHLSQPAVSAQIKALEEAVGLLLFERTARGMVLTGDGRRLLLKAEQTLAAHREFLAEARRLEGTLSGRLRLGANSNSNGELARKLITLLAARHPEVEVALEHGTSLEILAGLRTGDLDAGLYNDGDAPAADLAALEVSQFSIFLAAQPGLVAAAQAPDWRALAALPWIYPAASGCCGRTAESWFQLKKIRPARIISVDREELTRQLIAAGTGIGLLHADTAAAGKASGQLALLFEFPTRVQVRFAHLASRAGEPLLAAAAALVRDALGGDAAAGAATAPD